MKVYFISGLGADARVFRHIVLPQGYEAVYLDWIPPLKQEELGSYAGRLSEKIDKTEKFALVGLSMGGMIATEISKISTPGVTILLSSVPVSDQLPAHFKIAYALGLHKLIPVRLIKSATIIKRFFTAASKEDKAVIRQVIKESDPRFIRWAIGAILKWKNDTVPQCLWQIHGSRDEILPVKYTKPTHTIAKGTHMMVMNRAPEINALLQKALVAESN